MHNTLLQIGPFAVTLLGVFSVIGILAGLYVAKREAFRRDRDEALFHNLVLVALISAVAGARLYYALVFAPSYFLGDPLRILAFHEGGLSIQGALMGALAGVAVYCRFKRVSFWEIADIFAPGVILGQAIGRVGCDVFGVEASPWVWWAVDRGGTALHPVQLYESILNFLLFLGLWRLRGRTARDGELFLVYIIGFSLNRFAVEFFRVNPQAFGPFSVAHATSLAMIAVAAIVLIVRRASVSRSATEHRSPQPRSEAETAAGLPSAGAPLVVALLTAASIATYYLIYAV